MQLALFDVDFKRHLAILCVVVAQIIATVHIVCSQNGATNADRRLTEDTSTNQESGPTNFDIFYVDDRVIDESEFLPFTTFPDVTWINGSSMLNGLAQGLPPGLGGAPRGRGPPGRGGIPPGQVGRNRSLQDRISSDAILQADQVAREVLARVDQENRFFFRIGVDATRPGTTTFMHNIFISKQPNTAEVGQAGFLFTAATQQLVQQIGLTQEDVGALSVMRDHIGPNFPCPFPRPNCNPSARFRTSDGSCNNLDEPRWGMAVTPMQRFLPPSYQDGVQQPRTLDVFGNLLPSARRVSVVVHQDDSPFTAANRFTHMVMQFGQFIDHDLTNSPLENGIQESDISCCIDDLPPDVIARLSLDLNRRIACFPIQIPANDPRFRTTCMNFVRSLQAPNSQCNFGQREQMNQITSYMDGSQIYGSNADTMRVLREFRGGRMAAVRTMLLPRDPSNNCRIESPVDFCFRAGDSRVNEQMMLASVHTIWMREHNRIANQLSVINPGWNDERVFLETRKIVIAILQHITYLEWLPVILNPRIMRDFRLWPFREGFRNEYDRFIDPSIRNSFGAAAFRFGHTLVNSPISKAAVNFATSFSQPIPLNTMFGAVDQVLQDQGASVDSFVRGLLVDRPQSFDRFVANELTNRLFEDGRGNALDLIALNIQRGRDHGIPPYNLWRQWCGLPLIQNFGTGPGGFDNHPFDAVRALQTVYAHPNDIDLFPGALSEFPVSGGLVGPTFACIIARQFKLLMIGDRFWYENSDSVTGFTQGQLQEIRKNRLATLLCNNNNLQTVQPNVFLQPTNSNRRVPCGMMPQMDLRQWSDCQPGQWSQWGPWSACFSNSRQVQQRQCFTVGTARSCGCNGYRFRARLCNGVGLCANGFINARMPCSRFPQMDLTAWSTTSSCRQGGWGAWGAWSDCFSSTRQFAVRLCNNPAPSADCGGCNGARMRARGCTNRFCNNGFVFFNGRCVFVGFSG